jgi:hemerythrin superfamily protein
MLLPVALLLQLIHDLTVHSLAEEEVLYPEMTKHMGTRVSAISVTCVS